MSTELVYLGPGPVDESLAQTLDADFARRNKAECLAYIQAIKRCCGEPPAGATLRIQQDWHPVFGVVYREVAVEYDPGIPAAAEYASRCEDHAPTTWAEAGIAAPAQAIRRRG